MMKIIEIDKMENGEVINIDAKGCDVLLGRECFVAGEFVDEIEIKRFKSDNQHLPYPFIIIKVKKDKRNVVRCSLGYNDIFVLKDIYDNFEVREANNIDFISLAEENAEVE